MNVFTNKVSAFLTGFAGILLYWALLFIGLASVRTLLLPFVGDLGYSGDLTTLNSASGLLMLGLGGTVASTDTSVLQITLSLPLMVVPISLFLFMRYLHDKLTRNHIDRRQTGAFSAIGAAVAIVSFVVLTAGVQDIKGVTVGVSYEWLVPLILVTFFGFTSVRQAADGTPLAKLGSMAFAMGRAYKGNAIFLAWVGSIALGFAALIQGTDLVQDLELWQWGSAIVGLAILLPTLALATVPVLMGAPGATELNAFSGLALLEKTDYAWVRIAVIAITWLAIVVSAFRSAHKGNVGKNMWLKHLAFSGLVGILVAWLASIRVNIPTGIDFLSTVAQAGAPHGLITFLLFALAGLIYGLLAQEGAKQFVDDVVELIGKPASNVGRVLHFIFTLDWLNWVVETKKAVALQRFGVRKFIKYTVSLGLVGLMWFVGIGLAWGLQPFYNHKYAVEGRVVSAIQTGEAKEISKYASGETFIAVLGSSGSDVKLKISEVKSEFSSEVKKRISWDDGKYFIDVTSTRDYEKDPFLGIIPQWTGSLGAAKLPKITLKDGDHILDLVQVGKNSYSLNQTFVLPGKVKLSAGVDKLKFLKSTSVSVDASKDVTANVEFSIDGSKAEDIARSSFSYLRDTASECDTFTFKSNGEPSLSKYVGESSLPSIKTSVKGICGLNSGGDLDFEYIGTGYYDSYESKWIWTFDFR